MSPTQRLRWAIEPDLRRSVTLFFSGLAVFMGLGLLLALVEVPRVIAGALMLVMLVAWVVGACGMVGCFRRFFGTGSNERSAK